MVAAGGTGGHLFPARALAEELARREFDVELVTERRGERYGAGFPAKTVHRVPSATLTSRTPWCIAASVWTLMRGTYGAWKLVRAARPLVMVGFGGYPTLPPLFAAKLAGVPTAIHEQNAVMGRANRLLARFADKIALSYETTRLLPETAAGRARMTGAPVRDAVVERSTRSYKPPAAGGAINILIFGGSQGARFFSDSAPIALRRLPEPLRKRLVVTQQAREEDVGRVRLAYEEAGIKAEVESFFDDLPERIAKAHLVISRSGASTVAELTVIGRPAILVPLPHALDNDQLENATRLAEAGGARCRRQGDLTPESLANEIESWLQDTERLGKAAASAHAMGRADAVSRLADLVEEMVEARRGGEG